ncbi:hypothetical protein ACFY4I_19745 [Streptomyces scabiei]|uniref:hypothetical protein n=1 Tax=Streptomyces scabiei TaxID=1930 RepID=UPI0036939CE1
MTHLLSSPWGRLYTAATLLAVALWIWSAVRTLEEPGHRDSFADHLSSAGWVVCLSGFLFLGLHERLLRRRRGEAEALDARRVLDGIRSLPTSANGKVALAFAALGVTGWIYVGVWVRMLGRDMPLFPPGDDGELVVLAGTVACATAALFAATHFKERR